MRYRYRGKKRRMRKGMTVLLLSLSVLLLISCVSVADSLWGEDRLGFGGAGYALESVEQTLRPDGETAILLCDLVDILTVNSIELETFRGTSQAVKLYRDEILNDMLRDHYGLYAGNSQVLSTVDAAYPQNVISTWIPKEDFENTVFRCFGGVSVRHKSGDVFQYLKQADGYTAPVQAWEAQVKIQVGSLEETKNTYRMSFTLSADGETSAPYTAIFVKRNDGTCYFYSLAK